MQESELQSPELKTGLPADETHQDSVEATWASDQVTQASLVRWVNLAFKHCHSILSLSRLSLANSPLIVPALVLDPVSPTADERGRAVRLLLRWAVTQLAPGPVQYPIDSERPLDDPTWRDPLWWRYNILRHRYLEPLHPDEFIDGGRFTETLLALTGIPSPDTFFQERNRGVREVAERLWQQLADGAGNRALQEMALDDTYRPLRAHPTAQALLGIASTFDDVFPRRLLLSLAAEERLTDAEAGLGYLSTRRFLLSGDEGASLWISPVLRAYVYSHQPRREQQRRHRQVARDYEQQGDALSAAQHRQLAGEWPRAAEILLSASEALVNELQFDELREALGQFRRDVVRGQWREIQILLADLCARRSTRRGAAGVSPCAQRRRRSRRAGACLPAHGQALRNAQPDARPDLLPAGGGALHRQRTRVRADAQRSRLALHHAQGMGQSRTRSEPGAGAGPSGRRRGSRRHLRCTGKPAPSPATLRRGADTGAAGALFAARKAAICCASPKDCGNLGLLYQAMQDHVHAIAAHQEAMTVYQRLGNQELTASALLNIGMAFHLDGRLQDAVQHYQQCLTLCQEIGYPLVEVKARSNLAEVFAELGQTVTARRHWQAGYALGLQAGFEDQTSYFVQLSRRFDGLAELTEPPADTRGHADAPACLAFG
ncbi:MAG: tetratricopeptide repeat protein [Caldilineaceae bacterium]